LSKGGTYRIACSSADEACTDMKLSLERNGFRLFEEDRPGDEIVIRAAWGSRFFFLLHQYIPFTSWIKELQRCGCEARFWRDGDEIRAQVFIVPYTELLNREEVFILTQDYFERRTDEGQSDELWDKVFNSLTLEWESIRLFDSVREPEPNIQDETRDYSDSCPPRYNAKYCPYCRHCLPKKDRRYCDRHGIYL
jgi:hypothetical protein